MTTRANAGSIQFHRRLGFSLLGEGSEGEVPVVRDPRRTGGAAVVVEERLR